MAGANTKRRTQFALKILMTVLVILPFQNCSQRLTQTELSGQTSVPNPPAPTPSVGPVITVVPPATNVSFGTINFTVTDATSTVTTVTCQIDPQAYQPADDCSSGSYTYANLYATSIPHTLTITAKDAAGNQNTSTTTWTITFTTQAQMQAQVNAANWTAVHNQFCNGTATPPIAPFYWEIGNAQSGGTPLASGSVPAPTPGPTPVSRTSTMEIASASKMIFGTYAVQNIPNILSDAIATKFLRMSAGYNSFQDASCTLGNAGAKSVLDCYNTCCSLKKGQIDTCAINMPPSAVPAGDTYVCNSDYTPSQDGVFNYGGGHFQRFASVNVPGLSVPNGGPDGDGPYGLLASFANLNGIFSSTPVDLASTIVNYGAINLYPALSGSFSYDFPDLAGGVRTDAASYATILQTILGKNLAMYNVLGKNPICAWSKMPPNEPNWWLNTVVGGTYLSACASSGSPINYEALHYSYAHWVEDDPINGDGTFSSPGKFGFYPWIDKSKSYYGIVSRYESGVASQGNITVGEGWNSLLCGRQIRKAYFTGINQP